MDVIIAVAWNRASVTHGRRRESSAPIVENVIKPEDEGVNTDIPAVTSFHPQKYMLTPYDQPSVFMKISEPMIQKRTKQIQAIEI
jgi:hypothetical protein